MTTPARLIMEAAEALEYAHSQGVIHRDIKPHNLTLTPHSHALVTDFVWHVLAAVFWQDGPKGVGKA